MPRVLHHARDLRQEFLAVPGAPQQVEAHLHPRRDPARRDDPAGVDDARAADAARRGDPGQTVDRRHAGARRLHPVGLLAVRRRKAVEQAHHAVHPRAGAHAGEQRVVRQRPDELVQAAVVHLLARAEPAGDQERVHRRPVPEAVVREHREPGLGVDGPERVGDQERLEFGVESPRHREHPVGRREVDDLRVLEDVDPEPEAGPAHEGTGSPNSRIALPPRMLRLASSLRNGRSQISVGRSKSWCG